MKKLLLGLSVLSLIVFAVPVSAMTVTPSRVVVDQTFDVDCVADTDFYSIFNNSTYEFVQTGECDATDLFISVPGNYIIAATTSSVNSDDRYVDVVWSEQSTIQVVPDFTTTAGESISTQVTGSAWTNFLAGIGDFLVANLPGILAFVAALIGLGFLLVRVKRWIGRRA